MKHPKIFVQSLLILGIDEALPWRIDGTTTTIDVSQITADMLPCQWAYTFVIPVKQ